MENKLYFYKIWTIHNGGHPGTPEYHMYTYELSNDILDELLHQHLQSECFGVYGAKWEKLEKLPKDILEEKKKYYKNVILNSQKMLSLLENIT